MSSSNSQKKVWKGIHPKWIVVIAIALLVSFQVRDGWKIQVGLLAMAGIAIFMDSRFTLRESAAAARVGLKGRVPYGMIREGKDGKKKAFVEQVVLVDRTVQWVSASFSIMAVGTIKSPTPPTPSTPLAPGAPATPAAPVLTQPIPLTWMYDASFQVSDRSYDSKKRPRALSLTKAAAKKALDAVIDTIYSNLGSGHNAAILALHHKELTRWGKWGLTLAFMPWHHPKVFDITDANVDPKDPKSVLTFTVNYGDLIDEKIEEWKQWEAEEDVELEVTIRGRKVLIFMPQIEIDQAVHVIEFLPKEPNFPDAIDKANADLIRAEAVEQMIEGYKKLGMDVLTAKDLAEKTMKLVDAKTFNITGASVPRELAGIAAATHELLKRV